MGTQKEVKLLVWLLILNCPIKLATALCDRTCRSYPTKQKFLELKCKKKKDAMFYLDVRCTTTANERCSGSVTCSGQQQEVVRAVAEECYWNTRCYIPMNKTYPSIINIDGMCLNIRPDVLEASAICIRKKKIFSFYRMRSPTTKTEGVIRISESFPWDYSTLIPRRRITFTARPGKTLRVSFLEADVDTSDSLTLTSGLTAINITGQNRHGNFDYSNGDVDLEFKIASTSRSGKGFLLCFIWLNDGSGNQEHACDLVGAICDRGCRTYPTPQKYVELKCKRSVMFYVDVRSSSTSDGGCDGSVTCSGLQQEVIRKVAEECYWKSACYIPMNNTYPIVLNMDGMCINIFPHVMETRALCVKNKKIFDFYGMPSRVTKKEGVIRISETFPWDYSELNYRRITFNAKSGKKLRISFLEADLDRDVDTLKLTNGQSQFNVTEQNKTANFDFASGDVSMEFAVGSSSKRGKGFVLCFYWLGRRSRNSKHACDIVRGVKCLPGKTQGSIRTSSRRRNRGRNSN